MVTTGNSINKWDVMILMIYYICWVSSQWFLEEQKNKLIGFHKKEGKGEKGIDISKLVTPVGSSIFLSPLLHFKK